MNERAKREVAMTVLYFTSYGRISRCNVVSGVDPKTDRSSLCRDSSRGGAET